MSSWILRLTSLAVAIALSGSPAVLAACMASCVDGPTATAASSASPSSHAGHGPSAARQDVDASHAHHDAAAAVDTHTPSPRHEAPPASAWRVAAARGDCCPDATPTLTAQWRSERSSAAVLVAASPSPLPLFPPRLTPRGTAEPFVPISPPPPTRVTVPLRI